MLHLAFMFWAHSVAQFQNTEWLSKEDQVDSNQNPDVKELGDISDSQGIQTVREGRRWALPPESETEDH